MDDRIADEPHFAALGMFFAATQHQPALPELVSALRRCLAELVTFDWGCLLIDSPLPVCWLLHAAEHFQITQQPIEALLILEQPLVVATASRLGSRLCNELAALQAPSGETIAFPMIGGGQRAVLVLANKPRMLTLADAFDRLEALCGGLGLALVNRLLASARARQQRDLVLLDQVRAAIASTVDLTDLLDSVIRQIAATYNYAVVGLYLLQEGQLMLVGHVGCEEDWSQHDLSVGVVGRAVRMACTQFVPNVALDPDFLVLRADVQSEVAVPLYQNGQVCGVLNIESSAQILTEEDVHLIELLAAEFSIAIERVNLYSAALSQARQLALAERLRVAIAAQYELEEVCDVVVSAITEILGHACAALYLLEDGMLRIQASVGYAQARKYTELSLDQGLVGKAIRDRRPLLVSNLPTDPHYLPAMAGLQSGLYVPLIHGDTLIGVILVESPDRLTVDDLTFLATQSEQLAAVLVHGQLFAAERQQRSEFEAIYATALEVSARRDPTSLLNTVTDRACKLLHAEGGAIYLRDANSDELEVVVSHNIPAIPLGSRMPPGMGIAGLVVAEQRTVCINDYQTWSGRVPQVNLMYHAIAAAPLSVAGNVVGVIAVGRLHSNRPFTVSDQRLLELFAAQSAQAIETAQLLDHERRRRHELEVLQDVSKAITGALHFERLMQIVVEKAREVFNVPSALLLVRDEGSGYLEPMAWTGLEPSIAAAYRSSPNTWSEGQPQVRHSSLGDPDHAMLLWRPALATPMTLGERVIGVLLLFDGVRPRIFSVAEQRLAQTLVQQVAQAVENVRLYERERLLREDAEQSVNELRAVLGELEQAHDNLGRVEKLRLLGELASGVAHDFNNALAGVLAYTQLLLLEESDSDKRATLQQIEAAALDGKAIVARIQEFARPQQNTRFEVVDVNAVILNALEMTSTRWRDKRREQGAVIESFTRLDARLNILGNATDLHRVFVNLILNAVDAMPNGGTVAFTTADAGDQIAIEISDTGTGMPPHIMAKVFEPFYTTKAVGVGTGLGLSICEQVISRHGGTISVASTPNVGTRFLIRLPGIQR